MKIDDLDTDLILYLMEMDGGTTTDLAKRLVEDGGDYELKKVENMIRYRLDKMRDKDLLLKEGYEYRVNVERVFLTDAVMQLGIGVDVTMGMMLVVYPRDDALLMRQISFEEIQKNHADLYGKQLNIPAQNS